MNVRYLARAGLIAAIYVILVMLEIPLPAMAYGPIQVRIAEGLVLLPLIDRAAIPGVFIGCLLANFILVFIAPFGLIDVIGGSIVTLVAAYLTSKMPNTFLGVLPPVILNGLIVSIWVSAAMGAPYWITVFGIGAGELIAVGIGGSIVLYSYKRILKRV
ncbi:QueT transporter family protein [Sporosalibacterium faouarense]|uniref:QueT transporter family protein n=1 Tax=Sporosalibacterium faouarense TaxID=516123 RepID=UPI00141D2735|nr:QueT transporter family protein [Sporosalibacterium faouarense]MTI48961.1 QueT transporter family protein [Bacillota bacterium]